jgi:hypothetical protein
VQCESQGDADREIPMRDGDVWVMPDGHRPHIRESLLSVFSKCSQVKNQLTVVYNEESLLERRKLWTFAKHHQTST